MRSNRQSQMRFLVLIALGIIVAAHHGRRQMRRSVSIAMCFQFLQSPVAIVVDVTGQLLAKVVFGFRSSDTIPKPTTSPLLANREAAASIFLIPEAVFS